MTESRAWTEHGTKLLLDSVERLDDSQLEEPTGLPGWTRRHLLAHVASNAEALQRLALWARTGEEHRMYSSPEQRNRDIEEGSTRPAEALRGWVRASADGLGHDLAGLPDEAWHAEVVTAQGRTVTATEIPWMRAREVMVHSVDLDAGTTFADLPVDFLVALLDDVVGRRSTKRDGPALNLSSSDTAHTWRVTGAGEPVSVTGPVAELAAWLTGRTSKDLRSTASPGVPELPPWL